VGLHTSCSAVINYHDFKIIQGLRFQPAQAFFQYFAPGQSRHGYGDFRRRQELILAQSDETTTSGFDAAGASTGPSAGR